MSDAPVAPIPAVAYIRVSTAREEMVSPELQRAAIEARAARDGAVIGDDHWIEELDESGRGFGRKGVQRAIGLVRDGEVRRVYVWKYSRFGRNATLVGMNVAEMERAGGRLVSATEHVDAATAVGKFTRGMLWQIDEFYSNVIGEQWQEAHARRHRNGMPHSGAPRFGYRYHRTTTDRAACPQGCGRGECTAGYVPDPDTAPAVAWMYEAYNSGQSVLRIAVELNRRGYRTVTGKEWDQRTVRRFMDAGFAAGKIRVHDPVCPCGLQAQQCRAKILVPAAHEPVIGAEAWEEYERQRRARRYLPPRVENPVYPLSGLMRCHWCQGPMNTHPKTDKQGRYHPGYMYQCATYMRSRGCRGSWIARHRAEDVVHAWIHLLTGDEVVRARTARKTARLPDRAAADRDRLAADAQAAEDALTELTLQLARKVITADAYKTARDRLIAERAKAARALEEAAVTAVRASEPPLQIAASLATEWNVLPAHARRTLLGKLVDHIGVKSLGRGKAEVTVASVWGEVYLYNI